MDADLLREIAALPLPPTAKKTVTTTKRRGKVPEATTAQERFESYAGDLSEEVRRLQAELNVTRPQAKKFEEVRTLVKNQAKILNENDRLENRILKVLGLPINTSSSSDS